jgi:hypothetical protein
LVDNHFRAPGLEVHVLFEGATSIVHEMSGGRRPRDKIFINVVHAVDGAWNSTARP